jgi:ADP-ribosylglycohydrolase
MPTTPPSFPIFGTIIGDICGSIYEWKNHRSLTVDIFAPACRFTDDTVLSIAVADALLDENPNFAQKLWDYGRAYRNVGFGGRFKKWLAEDNLPPAYDSFGNGSAMRASATATAAKTLEEALTLATNSAMPTHNHPEGIKGAQAVAAGIFWARAGYSKAEIKQNLGYLTGYDLDLNLDTLRPEYKFDVTCQGSVPQAICAFLQSTDFENALRLAISLGGDSDTIAAITGGLAAAFYEEIPDTLLDFAKPKIPLAFWEVLQKFDAKFKN